MSDSLTDLSFAGLSDIGCQRTTNQDSYYLSPTGDLFIVADGMGGHAGGQEASHLTTKTIRRYLDEHKQSDRPPSELLEQAIFAANLAVLSEQRQHPEIADMGTTVVVLLQQDDQFWCAHVGDSRLYILRTSDLIQVTQDHTWVMQAVAQGTISPDRVQTHPWRNILSKCVGREDLQVVETQQLKIGPGDRLLLCSDGLTEELASDAIIGCMQSAKTCEEAVLALIEAAKARGGRDNITAIALTIPSAFSS